MIIFLYGDDSFSSKRKLNQVVEQYRKVHQTGLNLRFLDFEEEKKKISFQDLKNQFRTRSMFKEKKLFILKNALSDSDFKKSFLGDKESFLNSKDIVVFYEKRDFPKKDSFFVFLKEKAISQKFSVLGGKALEQWIEKEFDRLETKIDSQAKSLLAEYTGNDLWRLSNEIEKLSSYKGKGTVRREDIKMMVSPQVQTNIFKTIDFIASKQKAKALFLLHRHIEKGDSPLYLLSMINFQFRNLLVVKERISSGKSTRDLGLHPFVIRKSVQMSRSFDLKDLKRIYQKIFESDLNVKTGKVEPEAALDLLIAQI